eukprot:CAMPEP_0174262520 /NCGR_PEP_ID=MMETSP0439-20130205/13020_1 /TAXON_ID=0 /ORGANISM="Stereomyxa ramosa, Strain Chinc5" /LENGTH=362 /DNA_ID=CAMNT_0015347239 /DNA_START=67 /DNA_END=1155 /DNA_ORIENTATION=+
MNPTKITYKLFFGESDIRRISLEATTWFDFTTQLKELYPSTFHPELRVQYLDEEGDKITVSSEMEFQTMLQFHSQQSGPLKLYVVEGPLGEGKYFKDGPGEQILDVYQENTDEKPSQDLVDICVSVPAALKPLFPDGKILPYNLPPWIADCVTIKKIPGDVPTVDLDINLVQLFDALHNRALALMEKGDKKSLEGARTVLQVQLNIVPDHFLSLYNLACAESLIGNHAAAVDALRRSIENGYKNLKHLLSDPDLDNIRDCEGYDACIDLLAPQEEAKEPEAMEEESKAVEKEEEPQTMEEEPQKMEEPQAMEEEPKAPVVRSPWQSQLDSLSAMGFTDTELCEKLLNKHKGDVVKVVHSLLA